MQADGAVLLRAGHTVLLATVTTAPGSQEVDYLPLSIDYQEKYTAAGKVPGGFLKREGRLGDHEVLVARLIDRTIRPCLPSWWRQPIHVTVTLLSADLEKPADVFGPLAASAALLLAPGVPFHEPASAVRVARVEGKFLINPSLADLQKAELDLMVAGNASQILMLEGSMQEASEELLVEAIAFTEKEIRQHCAAQKELLAKAQIKKELPARPEESFPPKAAEHFYAGCLQVAGMAIPAKKERNAAFQQVRADYLAALATPPSPQERRILETLFEKQKKRAVRELVTHQGKRIDGRHFREVRAITVDMDCLPTPHGSALFTRGDTQVLATVTLGGRQDAQLIDAATRSGSQPVMLHYNFPAYCTGETKPLRNSPGRREIGHGHLALKAIKPVLPVDNPYTVRIVGDVLSSDGSSSMAVASSGSLALMDAGVDISRLVAGLTAGGVKKQTGEVVVLTDISEEEDGTGELDLKTAGTSVGLTACQMDIKQAGISLEVIREALLQAREGRLAILSVMEQAMPAPRPTPKPHAPRAATFQIPARMIGALIGPGGKTIQELQQAYGVSISVAEREGKGIVKVFAPARKVLDALVQKIGLIVSEPETGKAYLGKVKSLQPYGALVEFLPGRIGLLHIGQVAEARITPEQMEKILHPGQEIWVKLIRMDTDTERYELSVKALQAGKAANPSPGADASPERHTPHQ